MMELKFVVMQVFYVFLWPISSLSSMLTLSPVKSLFTKSDFDEILTFICLQCLAGVKR